MTGRDPHTVELGEAIQREAIQTAWADLELAQSEHGSLARSDVHRDLIEVGIHLGFVATMRTLVRRGLLPNPGGAGDPS